MLAAVLTLTRERLPYTQHCFERLRELAGMEYHHYVLDQDSKDGTNTFLEKQLGDGNIYYLRHAGTNVGIPVGMNALIEAALRHGGYDALVKFDNDCELTHPNTLKRAVEVAVQGQALVSPIVDGLRNPQLQIGKIVAIGDERVREMGMIGGIFQATPVGFWNDFRYPDDLPKWGTEDTLISQVAHHKNMIVGYIQGLRVNHYRTTDGQHQDFPSYFLRRQSEGGPP